jgi:hypothetical protein
MVVRLTVTERITALDRPAREREFCVTQADGPASTCARSSVRRALRMAAVFGHCRGAGVGQPLLEFVMNDVPAVENVVTLGAACT